MNHTLDGLARGLSQAVTRRQALRRFGVGLAGVVFAAVGLESTASAGNKVCRARCFDTAKVERCCAQFHSVGSDAYLTCIGSCEQICAMGAKQCMF